LCDRFVTCPSKALVCRGCQIQVDDVDAVRAAMLGMRWRSGEVSEGVRCGVVLVRMRTATEARGLFAPLSAACAWWMDGSIILRVSVLMRLHALGLDESQC
jgi:hypothetical protein